MNYQNVNLRLKQIYASIDQKNRYGGEVLSAQRVETEQISENTHRVVFSFGDDVEALNKLNSIISNLANLKDCLKVRMTKTGKDKQLIEDEVKKSTNIQIVLDLWNQDKHDEYPLKKFRHSKKDPRIVNVRCGIGPSDKPDGVTYSASDGSKALDVMVSIHADIVDLHGNLLCTFDQLVAGALSEWEGIIEKFNLEDVS